MSRNGISRRHFFYGTLLAGAVPAGGFGSTQSLKALGYRSPNEKLNLAAIGAPGGPAGGRGGFGQQGSGYNCIFVGTKGYMGNERTRRRRRPASGLPVGRIQAAERIPAPIAWRQYGQ